MTFATTITFAALTFLTGQLSRTDFASWFVGAILAFGLLMLSGVLANIFEETRLADPNKIYERCCIFCEWEFEKHAVALAGNDFKANTTTVKHLGASSCGNGTADGSGSGRYNCLGCASLKRSRYPLFDLVSRFLIANPKLLTPELMATFSAGFRRRTGALFEAC